MRLYTPGVRVHTSGMSLYKPGVRVPTPGVRLYSPGGRTAEKPVLLSHGVQAQKHTAGPPLLFPSLSCWTKILKLPELT